MAKHETVIESIPPEAAAGDIYRTVNSLALGNTEAGTLPFVTGTENPMPQDMEIVTGMRLGDINKVQLELKAARIGAKSLRWVFGGNAALLGLELKSEKEYRDMKAANPGFDTEPLVCFANVRRDPSDPRGTSVDAQMIYLLDQFTEESVRRLYSPRGIEEAVLRDGNEKGRKMIAGACRNALINISEYDTGLGQEQVRKAMRDNIRKNLATHEDGSENAVREEIFSARQEIGRDLSPEQKQLFEQLNTYFTAQQTGLRFTSRLTPEQEAERKESLTRTFRQLAEKDTPALTELMTDAYLFTDRTARIDFSLDKVYTKSDRKAKARVLSPAAAKFERDRHGRNTGEERKVERERVHERKAPAQTRGRY